MRIPKRLKICALIFTLLSPPIFIGCSDNEQGAYNYLQVKTSIAVFSDPHYYDLELGTSGEAWERAANSGRKMLAESVALTDKIVEELSANSSVKIVLVTGDLTKDGERASHEKFAEAMRKLEKAGKKVYVMPGNHDIFNPHSVAYKASGPVTTPNVTREEFANIYKEFGYGEALSRDENSLSYVVEPTPGLWIISMDASQGNGITAGRFSENTLNWIKERLTQAKNKGKVVFGMMHHGLVEHFTGQKANPISEDYVIDDWNRIATELTGLGLQMVFTGHFHANDITSFKAGDHTIYDVETGSLVTYPSAYRIVTLDDYDQVAVETKHITSINYNYGAGAFQDFSKANLIKGITPILENQSKTNLGLNAAQAKIYAPILAEAFAAHYYGDEEITAELMKKIDLSPTILVRAALMSLSKDLPPADNYFTFQTNLTIEVK